MKARIRTREYSDSLDVILSQLVVKLKEKGKKAASFYLHDWTATPLQSGVKSIAKAKAKRKYMTTTNALILLCCTLNIARVNHLPFQRDFISAP